jgi:hypothetical protein
MRSLRVLHGYLFTVIGIAIGVAGLVALGAMSERIVRFIEGGDRFVLGQISVAGRGMGMGHGVHRRRDPPGGHDPGDLRKCRACRASRRRSAPADPSTSQFMTVTQEPCSGWTSRCRCPIATTAPCPSAAGGFSSKAITRWRSSARRSPPRAASVGSHITLEDEDYEVVGVLDRMLTAPDRFVMVAIADARAQWVAKDRLPRTCSPRAAWRSPPPI